VQINRPALLRRALSGTVPSDRHGLQTGAGSRTSGLRSGRADNCVRKIGIWLMTLFDSFISTAEMRDWNGRYFT